MKILITGGSGFVGRNLVRFFAEWHSVSFTCFSSQPPEDLRHIAQQIKLDVRDARQVERTVRAVRCDLVIHLAGNKNVRNCEERPKEAASVNAEGTRNVALACKRARSRLIYISTDLVFDCLSGGYAETDLPRPNTIYGSSKLEGENQALSELPDVTICRSGGIYGPESPLFRWLATELQARREVSCLTNVKNTPTYVWNLGEMLEKIIRENMRGIFHTVGPDVVNRYEWFRAFADTFGLDSSLLRPVNSEELMRRTFLQPNASLDSEYTRKIVGVRSVGIAEGMVRFKAGMPTALHAQKL